MRTVTAYPTDVGFLQASTGATKSVAPVTSSYAPKGYFNLQAQGVMKKSFRQNIYIHGYIYFLGELPDHHALRLPQRPPILGVGRNLQAR